MNTASHLSINVVQDRIAELDAIVENFNALKAERDELKKALPALQRLAEKGFIHTSSTTTTSSNEAPSQTKTEAYQPKAGTIIERLYHILAEHPDGLTIAEIIKLSAASGVPFKYGSVSSQLSQLRKRKVVKKVKGLFSLK
jgi:hypothetical protein